MLYGLGRAFAQVGGDRGSEMIHPAANGLVGDQNPALSQQVFHIAKAERESKVQLDSLLNDLRREAVAGIADFRHARGLPRIQSASKRPAVTMAARAIDPGVARGKRPLRAKRVDVFESLDNQARSLTPCTCADRGHTP